MAKSGLRYSTDEAGERKISVNELESFYGLTVDRVVSDSQMRISNETEIENKLDALLEIAKLQLAATIENNNLLKEKIELGVVASTESNLNAVITEPVKNNIEAPKTDSVPNRNTNQSSEASLPDVSSIIKFTSIK